MTQQCAARVCLIAMDPDSRGVNEFVVGAASSFFHAALPADGGCLEEIFIIVCVFQRLYVFAHVLKLGHHVRVE